MINDSDKKKVEKIVLNSASSFYWGMNLLKKDQRRAMFSIYSFCRIVDDIADSQEPKLKKINSLNNWKKKIDLIYSEQTEDYLTRELKIAVEKYGLIKSDFIAIIDGMKMDINKKIVYPNQKKLDTYCDRVAGAVGCLSMKVFEINHKKSRLYAKNLGRAFQYTNILRDIKEDCSMGRCYIPTEIINKFDLLKEKPELLVRRANLKQICGEFIMKTKEYYLTAENLSLEFEKKKLKAPNLMKNMYQSVFKKICNNKWDNETKIRLGKLEKFLIILKSILN
ncbi:squalene/phytoene synthase family protein [Rickettsiales bacterium]|nr:squalene/phytoene synthase family protein [Rickettsiales bacterium]